MDRREDADLRERLDEIERGYIERADSNRVLIEELTTKTFRILAVLTVLLLFVGGWSVYLTWQGAEAHSAVCTFRGDLKQRVRGSEDFLRKHPQGIQDISAKEIQVGIANQRRTISALRELSCG